MIIAKRLKGKAIATWLGPTGDAARKAVANVRGKLTKQPRRLDFYVDIADPWSYVAAQAVERLVAAYGVDLAVLAVTPPASDVDPMPHLRTKQAVRDAQQLADYYDVEFGGKREADSGLVRDANTVLVRNRAGNDQLRAVLELGKAVWATDRKEVSRLLGAWGHEGSNSVPPILNTNYAVLRKAGHYSPGAIAYGGEWFTGIDRLPYLEQQLAADTGRPLANVIKARTERAPEPLSEKKQPLACELWFSFRSPYSYLALEQIEDILEPYGVPLVLRAVAPMVSRGMPLPPVKRMYILRDAKREADRLGIPFGDICDPLGAGVDNCLSIIHWALQRSPADGLAFAKSAMRGIWSEAKDVAEYVDLKAIVERANLPWDEAKAAIGDAAAAKAAQLAANDLAVYGLWGVPSVRVGDFVAWGQDRLTLLSDRLQRDALATAAAK